MEFHNAANLFPLDQENIAELAKDIQEHGLQVPVELYDGKIIDGRRRFMACESIEVEPDYVTVSPDDPIAYVLSLNLHRRQLSASQRAMVASKARELYDQQAKERQSSAGDRGSEGGRGNKKNPSGKTTGRVSGDARDMAGKAVGVSGKMVDHARTVREKGVPELAKAVEEGRLAVSRAAQLADEDEETQREVAKNAEFSSGRFRKQSPPEKQEGNGKEGKGIIHANAAIDCLKKIPKNDALRKRGFQLVTDWIRKNK